MGSRLKIAFVVNNYPPRVGGVESHVASLARELVRLGHSVTVVTLSESPGHENVDGIDVFRLREYFRIADVLGFPPVGASRRIARLLRERRVDLISIHTRFFPMSWIGLRVGRSIGLPVIHTEHGSNHVVSTSLLISFASKAVDHTIGRYVLRRSDEVLGVSESVLAFIRRLSGRTDAEVFYNAIESRGARADVAPRRHLVFVGRLVPGKGVDVFIDALSLLRSDGEEFTAEVLGDGVLAGDTAAAVRRLGLQDRVVMRGRVTPAEVSEALTGAMLVNPSSLAEGFQTTLLEALDVGGSVVTYDVPGARLLRDRGYAVHVVSEHTPSALSKAVVERLGEPWVPLRLDDWYWSARAQDYSERASRVVRVRRMAENRTEAAPTKDGECDG